MKTFREFLEEAYLIEMRKEDKVKGKKKTPLYVNPEKDVIQRSPKGNWKKTRIKQFSGKGVINPVVSQARMKRADYTKTLHGSGTSGHTGHSSSGIILNPNDPGSPQPHGTSGGKAGSLRGVRQRGKPKNEPIGDPSTPITKFNYRTPAQKVKERRARASSSGYDYKAGRGRIG
jgi:hypothetical protein